MTTPNLRPGLRYGADDSPTDWFLRNKNAVSWALLAIAVAIAGMWFFQRSRSLRQENAEKAYFQARQAAAAGNLPLAASDLKKVATRYEGTRPGTQAALFLAQSLYDQKKHQEGLAELDKALSSAPKDFVASIHVLKANGYEELKDFVRAAAEYEAAATATKFPAEKAQYQAAAARSYMSAGKAAEARAIWAELAADETSPLAAEARVRLGEIVAKPMTT
ncbi:MAG TPA: tetratricopeptide repeat protein [Gemmatimonadaceae bacterium]|nr:tetratricopeptide repeat protein [Gemmatimonadaceae bacterium]